MPEVLANIQQGKYEEVLAAVQSPVISLTELIKNASDSCKNSDDPIIVEIDREKRVIRITDSGIGFSKEELDHLGEAGYSSKMINGNIKTPIDNPFAGSKGLGLLTAFFIAEVLMIDSFSEIDGKTYHLRWEKGLQKYSYEETEKSMHGTVVSLIDVAPDKLQMILLPEEKVKLFMASLRFFTNDTHLPRIRLIIDGIEESYYPNETLESFYSRNKGAESGFVAKASFEYKDNVVSLSYEDNTTDYYSFFNHKIDLADPKSVDSFVKAIRAPEGGIAPIKAVCESRVFNHEFLSIHIPAFSGVLYTWRNRKNSDIEKWPSGVRIYTNNYSLYRYLDKENDWLNLSEISQNIRATNYKLKNTYGYIDLNDYNENEEVLKISKERDDFVDSMAQRKFIHVIRDVIIGVFTRIDMAAKNAPIKTFSLRETEVNVRYGESFNLASYIVCNNIGLDDISLNYDESTFEISDDWIVSAKKLGSFEIKLVCGDIAKSIIIHYKKVVPEFSLVKNTLTVLEGNTVNLRGLISIESCVDISPDDIEIIAEKTSTIIESDCFDRNNKIGNHIINYRHGDYQRRLVIDVKEIDRQPGFGVKSPSISSLFGVLDELRRCSIKIPELVDAISSYYQEAPTLCMAAVRILVDCSTRAFILSVLNEDAGNNLQGNVDRVIKICECNKNNSDYTNCIERKGSQFVNGFNSISSKHKLSLSREVRKCIDNTIKDIDLNMFVHNPNAIATDTTVQKTMQIFAPMLNYIFEILILDYSMKH